MDNLEIFGATLLKTLFQKRILNKYIDPLQYIKTLKLSIYNDDKNLTIIDFIKLKYCL